MRSWDADAAVGPRYSVERPSTAREFELDRLFFGAGRARADGGLARPGVPFFDERAFAAAVGGAPPGVDAEAAVDVGVPEQGAAPRDVGGGPALLDIRLRAERERLPSRNEAGGGVQLTVACR